MKKIYLNIILAAFFLGVAISPAQALMFSDLNWTDYDNDASYKSFAGGETGLGYDIHFQALGVNLAWNPSDGGASATTKLPAAGKPC